ncbi:hypothetical protein [Haloarchaeobius sp. HRN-SO-5]|uniref:hypothetical protein n=1 Tax=Haloarchaeobius sp. HRN-SO-5 TaxID=3446118 RepID=UPI003EC079F6
MASLSAQFREASVLVSLSLASLLACIGMFVGTMVLLVVGFDRSTDVLWLTVVGVGVGVTVLWNVLFPLYDRVSSASG